MTCVSIKPEVKRNDTFDSGRCKLTKEDFSGV